MNETISALLVLAVTLLALGCSTGASALHVNANIARAMLDVQATSGPIIREARVNAGVNAARRVRDSGGTIETAQSAATFAADRWQCAVDGHRIYSEMVGAYIDALSVATDEDSTAEDYFIPFVSRVIDAYSFLASCLSSLGNDTLPTTPSFLGGLAQ